MQTWEMIKELTENPNKSFQNKASDGDYFTIAKLNKDGYLEFIASDTGEECEVLLTDTWEPIET